MAGARERIARSMEREFPRWRIWWHSWRWMARRRGNFEALEGGGSYLVTAPGLHEFRVILRIEDGREPRGAWRH